MKPAVKIVLALAAVAAIGAGAWWAWLRPHGGPPTLPGYVEGDVLYLSSPGAGTVARVFVAEGQRVAAGAALFTMDPATLSAVRGQAQARLAQSLSQVGAAAARAAQARASADAARAAEAEARVELNRQQSLARANPAAAVPRELDQARANLRSATAQRQAAARAAQAQGVDIAASRAGAGEARAALAEQASRLEQLAPRAPAAGRIETVFYQAGEWAAANQPVIALLPDDEVKLRFYVREAEVQRYRPGAVVGFSCDGCARGLRATVSYVSPRPEFTPPVIYSRDSREKLVFLIEARPTEGARLAPGLPVDVEPLGGANR